MAERGSAIWGGATLGLIVGLILGFFVGSYWTTVLYAVLIGAASGVVANLLALPADIARRREGKKALREEEDILRANSPADFETTPNTALDCIAATHYIVDGERWRAGYDSLESFYAAHETRHPDIRVYASVYEDDDPEIRAIDPSDFGRAIARRIADRRRS